MNPFKIEGPFCFAKVPPGFDIETELYDFYPDGSKNLILRVVPLPPVKETTNA